MNPPSRKHLPSSPAEWMEHARSDMRYAMLGLEETAILPHHICFHIQQAAEKALKSVLIFHKIDFPPIHDIQQLLRLLEKNGIIIPYDVQNAGILTPYAVETRYPGYWGDIRDEEMHEAVILAEAAMVWAERLISNETQFEL